jgi:hypothetical protein
MLAIVQVCIIHAKWELCFLRDVQRGANFAVWKDVLEFFFASQMDALCIQALLRLADIYQVRGGQHQEHYLLVCGSHSASGNFVA